MPNIELHKYLPLLPEIALQEFTEWCVLEQSKAAGYKLTPDTRKLNNLPPGEYIPKLIDQFMKVKPDPIKAGLVAVMAGNEADKHALSGLAIAVDFVSLYVKYLTPPDGNSPEQAEAILTQVSQQQYEKLSQIAEKHGIKF